MSILLVGISYQTATLDELEVLEANSEDISRAIYEDDALAAGIESCVIVSTCNRFEAYVDTQNEERSIDYIIGKIRAITQREDLKFTILESRNAVHHLFRVSSGLESMIVGEVEIAGQVKRSLSQAQNLQRTSRITEALFQRASQTSKRISSDTGLGSAGRSLITGGIDLLKKRGYAIEGSRVLVIGTGAYARVVTAALERENVGEILVFSNSGRAEIFSESHPTTPVSSDGLHEVIKYCDLIVACSGTHGTIISEEDLRTLRKADKALPIIDLSLSRDVEKSVQSIPHVDVIDLEEIYKNSPKEHIETLDAAERIIGEEVESFLDELKARRNDPLVRLLRGHVEEIVKEEVERVRRKNGEEAAALVETSLNSTTKAIFHKPTVAARESAINNESIRYEEAINLLFGLQDREKIHE